MHPGKKGWRDCCNQAVTDQVLKLAVLVDELSFGFDVARFPKIPTIVWIAIVQHVLSFTGLLPSSKQSDSPLGTYPGGSLAFPMNLSFVLSTAPDMSSAGDLV